MTTHIRIDATLKPEFEAKAKEVGPDSIHQAWLEDIHEMTEANSGVYTFEVAIYDD